MTLFFDRKQTSESTNSLRVFDMNNPRTLSGIAKILNKTTTQNKDKSKNKKRSTKMTSEK